MVHLLAPLGGAVAFTAVGIKARIVSSLGLVKVLHLFSKHIAKAWAQSMEIAL